MVHFCTSSILYIFPYLAYIVPAYMSDLYIDLQETTRVDLSVIPTLLGSV